MALFDDGSVPRPGGELPPHELAVPSEAVTPAGPEPGRRHRRGKKKSSPARSAIEWALVIAGALLVAFLIRTFLLAAFYIPSASMVATLEEGDRVLVNKLSYHLHDVHRGDIVVFERPPSEPDTGIEDYIKRVIGLPGDVIDVQGLPRHRQRPGAQRVLRAREGSVHAAAVPAAALHRAQGRRVGHGRQPRGRSTAARSAPIKESTIVGRAFLRIWPLSHLGFL